MAITAAELQQLLDAFPWDEWNRRLGPDLSTAYRDLVTTHGTSAASAAGGTWNAADPFLSRFMTRYVGERITQLEATTRREVSELIRSALDQQQGASVQELASAIGDTVRERFDGYEQYRALRIARSEAAIAANHGNVLGLAQAGVRDVEVLDGTDDEPCADANGATWSVQEALANPIAHPNCSRAFSGDLEDQYDEEDEEEERRTRRYERWSADQDDDALAQACAAAAERIARQDDPHARALEDATDGG